MKIFMILSVVALLSSCTQKQKQDVAELVKDGVTVVEDIVDKE